MATTVRQVKFNFSCLQPGKFFEAVKYFESANIVLPTFFAVTFQPAFSLPSSLNENSYDGNLSGRLNNRLSHENCTNHTT